MRFVQASSRSALGSPLKFVGLFGFRVPSCWYTGVNSNFWLLYSMKSRAGAVMSYVNIEQTSNLAVWVYVQPACWGPWEYFIAVQLVQAKQKTMLSMTKKAWKTGERRWELSHEWSLWPDCKISPRVLSSESPWGLLFRNNSIEEESFISKGEYVPIVDSLRRVRRRTKTRQDLEDTNKT